MGDVALRQANFPAARRRYLRGGDGQGDHAPELDTNFGGTQHRNREPDGGVVRGVHVFPHVGGSAHREYVPRFGDAPWAVAGVSARGS